MLFRVSALITVLIATTIGLSACASAKDRGARARIADEATHTMMVGARERSYVLVAPPSSTKPLPLVIALHGGGGDARHMIEASGWADLARTEGFVAAFPNGSGRLRNFYTWNAHGCCGYAMTSQSDDVLFIDALISELVENANVDPSRVYITGLSNGGMLTYRLASVLPGRIAAVGPVVGAMFDGTPAPDLPVPAMIINAVNDEVVPYEGGMSERRRVRRAQSAPFLAAEDAAAFWVDANTCRQEPKTHRDDHVTSFHYTDCQNGADVTFYRLERAGHSWPGSLVPPFSSKLPYRDLDATRVLWTFFKGHSR